MKPLTKYDMSKMPDGATVWALTSKTVSGVSVGAAKNWNHIPCYETKEAAEKQLKYEQILKKLGKQNDNLSNLTLDDYGRTYTYTAKNIKSGIKK